MLSILLINDNKIVSRLLQLSSKKNGFDIEESGIFSPQKDFYNLIFVDSDKYSDELIDKIKENLTYDKLVFIGTAQVKKPEGFELVLEKPFLPTDFTALVEKNFILDNQQSDKNEEKIETKEEEEDIENIDSLLDEEFDLDDDLENSTTEDLAQMVDEIDNIDNENKDNKENDNIEDDNLDDLEEDMEIDKEEKNSENDDELFDDEFDENELGIDEELLQEDEEDIEKEEETPLPDIDDEIEDEILEEKSSNDNDKEDEIENTNESQKNKIEDIQEEENELDKIDRVTMKQLLEPKTKENNIKEEIEEIEETEEVEENNTIEENKSSQNIEDNNFNINETNLEDIIKEKLQEILTPDLIKSALKDMKITISFEDK